jgi:hypothetical protein
MKCKNLNPTSERSNGLFEIGVMDKRGAGRYFDPPIVLTTRSLTVSLEGSAEAATTLNGRLGSILPKAPYWPAFIDFLMA